MTPRARSSSTVAPSETSSEPMQPSRFEKKTNTSLRSTREKPPRPNPRVILCAWTGPQRSGCSSSSSAPPCCSTCCAYRRGRRRRCGRRRWRASALPTMADRRGGDHCREHRRRTTWSMRDVVSPSRRSGAVQPARRGYPERAGRPRNSWRTTSSRSRRSRAPPRLICTSGSSTPQQLELAMLDRASFVVARREESLLRPHGAPRFPTRRVLVARRAAPRSEESLHGAVLRAHETDGGAQRLRPPTRARPVSPSVPDAQPFPRHPEEHLAPPRAGDPDSGRRRPPRRLADAAPRASGWTPGMASPPPFHLGKTKTISARLQAASWPNPVAPAASRVTSTSSSLRGGGCRARPWARNHWASR